MDTRVTNKAIPDYSLLDEVGLGETMFYPRSLENSPPQGASDLLIDIEPSISIGARFYLNDVSGTSLLYFHGNGEVASDYDKIATLYREIGVNLFVVDYRGYGQSSGDPTFAALIDDARPIAQYFHNFLNQQHLPKDRYIMGRSLGAYPAIDIAACATAGFRGLILESGAGNMRRSVERIGLLETERGANLVATHEANVGTITLPVLLIHGEIDMLVPKSVAKDTSDLLTATTTNLEVIPGAGHNDLLWIGREQYFDAIGQFISSSN